MVRIYQFTSKNAMNARLNAFVLEKFISKTGESVILFQRQKLESFTETEFEYFTLKCKMLYRKTTTLTFQRICSLIRKDTFIHLQD